MIAPFLIELDEALELGLKIIRWLVGLLMTLAVVERVFAGGFGGGLGSFGGFGRLIAFRRLLVLDLGFRSGGLFQNRVLLQLLLYQRLKLESRRLEESQ